MMPGIRNADLTLYHKGYDPVLRDDVWTATQYQGVSWHGGQAASVTVEGLHTADVYVVRIYAPDALAAAVGDIVCRGLHEEADHKTARKAAAESFVVTGVWDNRRGSPNMRHWRLEGK